MRNKFFESSVNLGFRLGYVPFVASGILLLLWFLRQSYLYEEDFPWMDLCGRLFLISLVVELILCYFLGYSRKLTVYRIGESIELEILEGNGRLTREKVVFVDSWWSYNAIGSPKEVTNWGDSHPDYVNDRTDGLSGTTPALTVIIFMEFESEEKKKVYLYEKLDNSDKLPKKWGYRVIHKKAYLEGVESYKLGVLRERILDNN